MYIVYTYIYYIIKKAETYDMSTHHMYRISFLRFGLKYISYHIRAFRK